MFILFLAAHYDSFNMLASFDDDDPTNVTYISLNSWAFIQRLCLQW